MQVKLFTSEIALFTSEVNPFTSEIALFTSKMNLFTSEVNKPTSEVNRFILKIKTRGSEMNLYLNRASGEIILRREFFFAGLRLDLLITAVGLEHSGFDVVAEIAC